MNRFWRDGALKSPRLVFVVALGALATSIYWGWVWWHRPVQTFHRHDLGSHGGTIVAVGPAHFHVEALIGTGGALHLYTLGQDQSQVVTVPIQKLTAYVRIPEAVESTAVELVANPQPNDPKGETSSFEGQLPLEYIGMPIMAVVPSIQFGKSRFRFNFSTRDSHEAMMPQKVSNEAERTLYLTPGGMLSAADIVANGSITPSQKYRGFQSTHDMHPVPGDIICPITSTKANRRCTWIVAGKEYAFCCPPCIDEFVKMAKEHPEQVKAPTEYRQN